MLYKFDDYCLDVTRQELRRGSDLIAVEPQVLDLLHYLIRNRERVVSKDDLIVDVWKGRAVSDSALTSRIAAARQAVGDTGHRQRLIRTLARKGIRFVGAVQESDRSTAAAVTAKAEPPVLSLPERPSIAVLPFANLSGDPEQEYFADGIVEDIITALSRFKELFVIARNSSFTYKGRAVDVKQVARELGVRYMLEGSVRKAANRVRITGQLVEATTAAHIWADRIDGEINDIFDLQDQVTERVVGAIAPAMEKAEIERAKRKPTEILDAYALYLRGLAKYYLYGNRRAGEEALRLFYAAIELDPDFAAAYGHAASCYAYARAHGWLSNTGNEIAEVSRLTRRAIELGKDDAVVLTHSGWALAFAGGDLAASATLLDHAIALNSNLAYSWVCGGWVKNWLGEPELAIERFTRAMRLSPVDPHIGGMQSGIAHARFFLGQYAEAAMSAATTLQYNPDYISGLRIAAASNAMAGQLAQAHKAMARLRQISPGLRISNFKNMLGPYRRAEDALRYEEGLRKAGLPQ
jgi:TolB-like protein